MPSREPPLREGVRSSTGAALASLLSGLRIGNLESRDDVASDDVDRRGVGLRLA